MLIYRTFALLFHRQLSPISFLSRYTCGRIPEYSKIETKTATIDGRGIDVANTRCSNSSAMHKYCIRTTESCCIRTCCKRYMRNKMSVILFNSLHVPRAEVFDRIKILKLYNSIEINWRSAAYIMSIVCTRKEEIHNETKS